MFLFKKATEKDLGSRQKTFTRHQQLSSRPTVGRRDRASGERRAGERQRGGIRSHRQPSQL